MAYDYEKLYQETPNALGEPTKSVVDFFGQLGVTNARVLDVGCGQGRDALFVARLGHNVVGVDLSASGIADLNAQAKSENLRIKGEVGDIRTYQPEGMFDVVLIDRTLHMLAEAEQSSVLARCIEHVSPEGFLLIADELDNMARFIQDLETSGPIWSIKNVESGVLLAKRLD